MTVSRIMTWVLLIGLAGAAGCGGGTPPLNTAPLTEEEKAKIKALDKQIDDEERSGSGAATKRKRR